MGRLAVFRPRGPSLFERALAMREKTARRSAPRHRVEHPWPRHLAKRPGRLRKRTFPSVEIEACGIFDGVAVRFLGQLAGLNQRSGEMSGGNGIVISHVEFLFFDTERL
jgi:hypothetical protein